MSRNSAIGSAALAPACWVLLLCAAAARADDCPSCAANVSYGGSCAGGNCGKKCFCPCYDFCVEKPPKIHLKGVCSKPVCDPCDLENYGYYPTCWRPWLAAPNYAHCPTPPPSVFLAPYGGHAPIGDEVGDETLPSPRKMANPAPNR